MKKLFLLLLTVISTQAITTTFTTRNQYLNGTLVDVEIYGVGYEMWAGELKLDITGPIPPGYSRTWTSYETDVFNYLFYQGHSFSLVNSDQAHNQLFEKYPDMNVSYLPWVDGGYRMATELYLSYKEDYRFRGAILQTAIWEALYGDNFLALNEPVLTGINYMMANRTLMPADQVPTWWMPVDENGVFLQGQGLIGLHTALPETGWTFWLLLYGVGLVLVISWRARP